VTERFYRQTMQRLLATGWLRAADEVLVVAGGRADHEVLLALGFHNVTISNLDERVVGDEYAPHRWSSQNAEALAFPDRSFDVCVVHQGLHHCRSPHRGLVEMYRVARRGAVMFEPNETALTRLGVRLGIGQAYECAAVADNDLRWGGVENSAVPNFVYRWTEREVRKTLAAFDPTGEPRVQCFYGLRVPDSAAASVRRGPARLLARAAPPLARATLGVFPRQANALAVAIDRLDPAQDAHPWLVADGDDVRPDTRWFGATAPPSATAPRPTEDVSP
jgi:SAM-dependent methyltransferase